jgi:hypothetical protein
MAVSELIKIIPPPSVPRQVGASAEWQAVEDALGVRFPSDYREFVFTYGTGQIGGGYSVWNPFEGNKYVEHVRLICGYERDFRERFPHYSPYRIYPDCPGFLPWGGDDNGNYYGWLTDGPPDRWPVLSHEIRGEGFRLHRCTMTGYFVAVFRDQIVSLAGYEYADSKEALVFETG